MHNFSKIHLLFISVFLYYAGMEFQSDQSVLPDFQSFLSRFFSVFSEVPRPYYRTRMNTSGSYALVPSCLWLSFRTTRLRPRLPLYFVSGRSVPSHRSLFPEEWYSLSLCSPVCVRHFRRFPAFCISLQASLLLHSILLIHMH